MKLTNCRFLLTSVLLISPLAYSLLSKIVASTNTLNAEFLLRLSQSPCAQTLMNLSLWCRIAPFELEILKQVEVFPILR